MPGAATSQSTCVAQPPQRFRSSLDAGERKSAPGDAPVPLGMPRPRLVPKSPRSAPATPRSASNGDAAASFTPRASDTPISTNRCEVPVVSGREQPKACSIMELVNQAARREEEQEAAARRGLCASPRISSSRGASPRAAPFSPHSSSTSDFSGRDVFRQPSSGRPPVASSPRASGYYSNSSAAGGSNTPRSAAAAASPRTSMQHNSASPFSAASPRAAGAGASKPPPSPLASPAGTSAHRHAAAGTMFANANSSRTVAGTAAAGQQHLPAHPTGTAAARPSGFASAAAQLKPAVQLPLGASSGAAAAAAAGGSDCASDDGSLTPESSLCSSASNSSLCSYGSLASSSCSLGSRPKSILVRRSHSCSSGSSSPGGPKHVRWRDGESVREDAGHDLVAVLILQDTPEIRRLRKDTWPERSKGRDLSVTIPTISSSGSSSSAAAAAAGGEGNAANPLVATVMDWKEKLRALSAERRAQRVEALQATWTARQAQQQLQQQRQQQERQRKQQQEQQQQQMEIDAAAPAADASATGGADASGTPAAAAAGITTTTVAAAAQVPLVKAGAGLPSAGPVINLQAVSGSCVSHTCC